MEGWVQKGLWGTPFAALGYAFRPCAGWFKQGHEGQQYNLLEDTLNNALVLNLHGRTVDEGIVMGKHVLALLLDKMDKEVIKFGQSTKVRAAHTLHPLEIHALTCVCAACAQTMESALRKKCVDRVRNEQKEFTTAEQQLDRCAKPAATSGLHASRELEGGGGGWRLLRCVITRSELFLFPTGMQQSPGRKGPTSRRCLHEASATP